MATAVSSFCGSRMTALKANAGLTRKQPVCRGAMAATMRKKGIHPEYFSEAKVFCNGVEVMTLGGTRKEYVVDIYSGNHPFYQGTNSMMISDEGQLNKFKNKFAGLEDLLEISATAAMAAPEEDKPKKKAAGGKGGKKKR